MKWSRIFLITVVTFLLSGSIGIAQEAEQTADTGTVAVSYTKRTVRDSAYMARQKFVTDSIIKHTWLFPDSMINRHMIMDSIIKANTHGRSDLFNRYKDYRHIKKGKYRTGQPVPKGSLWVPGVVAVLLLIFAVLKVSFAKQLQAIVQSFFSNRVLNNLSKEDNLFSSWPFLLLFVQFGFTIGMFFYLVSQYYHISFPGNGFQAYLSISVAILVLYAFKILLLRLLGYVFNIQKPVNEYIIILYLSYFNLSLLFIPLVIAFALAPLKYAGYYIGVSFILLGVIFVFQFIRAGLNILSHNRFPKVYLFLYFCALEICPILILIKAIGL